MLELGPLQKEWMRRARSGEYERGSFRLCKRYQDGKLCYCFLGLACAVYEDMVKTLVKSEEGGVISFKYDSYDTVFTNSLPFIVADTLKLHSIGGDIRGSYDDKHDCLWKLNDLCGWSFDKIADFVEANPESVFSGPA